MANDNERAENLTIQESERVLLATPNESENDNPRDGLEPEQLTFAVDAVDAERAGMSGSQAWNLYASHALSTWNARTYEFAAIIFTAAAYPDTLVASSLRGIATTLASICLSSVLGRYIDSHTSRLTPLLSTITINRLSVVLACGTWYFLVPPIGSLDGITRSTSSILATAPGDTLILNGWIKNICFAAVIILGVLEKLSAVGNMMAMERDWVVCVAGPPGHRYDLTSLNAVMRRIDLTCKLIAPLVISVVVSLAASTRLGVLVVLCMSAVSWAVEIACARSVWKRNPKLRAPKTQNISSNQVVPETIRSKSIAKKAHNFLQRYARDFKMYFSTNVWIPSMSLALLHLSVLSYSATFITYLLSMGFSLNLITIARAAGSVVEISSTVVTPFGVEVLGRAAGHGTHLRDGYTAVRAINEEEEGEENVHPQKKVETGLERLGLWGVTWQLLNLIPVVLLLTHLTPSSQSPPTLTTLTTQPPPLHLTLPIFTFLTLSRLGLWIFDLTTQQLTQTLTSPTTLSSFAGVESSFVSFFELGNYVAAIVFSEPEQFAVLAIGSLVVVGISVLMYAGWVRGVRGHLMHFDRVACACGREK